MLPFPPRFVPPLGPPKSSSRERVLTLWRGTNLAPIEKAQELRAKAPAEAVKKVLANIRFEKRRGEAEIVKVWNGSLNPKIVAHAQPTGLRNGTLFVSVDSSVWLSEILRFHKQEILERMRHSFGGELVKKISFRVG